MKYINEFFLYSILGHLIESLFYFIFKIDGKSGFLYLWWTPVYGIGILVAYYFYKRFKVIKNKYIRYSSLFLGYFFVFSILECIGGTLLEKLYGYSFWNYLNIPLHIGKYVSVFTSIGWSIMAFLYIFCFKKITDKVIKYIPRWLTVFLIIVFIFDILFSLLEVIY
ncbi:MAG: hypothetical protein ACI4XM_07695 [Candidatus Coprovivens sp.]